MNRLLVSLGVLLAITPGIARAQLQEMRQTIFGMD